MTSRVAAALVDTGSAIDEAANDWLLNTPEGRKAFDEAAEAQRRKEAAEDERRRDQLRQDMGAIREEEERRKNEGR